MKSNTFKAITLYFYLLLFCSCRLFFDMDCNDNYKFYLPFTLYPAQDTFHINDTIHLHANFSDMLLDSNSLNYYKVENEPLACFFALDHLDTLGVISAFPNFTLIVDTGNTHPGGGPGQGLRLMQYLYINSRYKFHARLVPHKKGVYGFHLNSFSDQLVDFQNRCQSEAMDIFFTLNNSAESNYYLILQSPDTLIASTTKEVFDKTGGYAFYVIE